MLSEPRIPVVQVVLVGVVALAVLGMFAGERALFDPDEGRYAAVGLQMAESGDYVVPRLDDMPFMDKPPLIYWIHAALLKVMPPSALAARAPTLLAGACWVALLFLFAFRVSGRRDAALAAAALAVTSAAAVIGGRLGPSTDMPLAACVAGALLAALSGIEQAVRSGRGPGVVPALGLGLSIGLGLLAKGPLVAAVPLVVACAWMLAGVSPRAVVRTAFAPLAWFTALLIAAPWYVMVERAMPGWISHFVHYEHLGRFERGDHRGFAPFWFYVPVAVIYLLPWARLAWGRAPTGASLGRRLLGPVLESPWSPRPWRVLGARLGIGSQGREVAGGRLAFAWFLAGFLLYSASTRKLFNYLLPVAAPLFVLAGAHLVTWRGRALLARGPLLCGTILFGAGLAFALGLWFPLSTGTLPTSLEAPRYAPLAPFLMGAGGLLASAALLATRSRRPAVVLVLAAMACWWMVDLGFARASALGSSRGLALALDRAADPGTPIVTYRRFPQGLAYYREEGVWIAGGRAAAFVQREIVEPYATREWLARPRDAAGTPRWTGTGGLLSDSEFERVWTGEDRVIVVCRHAEIAPLGGRILSGPHAGAGRTDLFVLDNVRP